MLYLNLYEIKLQTIPYQKMKRSTKLIELLTNYSSFIFLFGGLLEHPVQYEWHGSKRGLSRFSKSENWDFQSRIETVKMRINLWHSAKVISILFRDEKVIIKHFLSGWAKIEKELSEHPMRSEEKYEISHGLPWGKWPFSLKSSRIE